MRAWLDDLSAYVAIDASHACDQARVEALVAHVAQQRRWDLPPVLVVESAGNGVTVLDGHHRLAAARILADQGLDWDLGRMPCWMVCRADYEAHVAEHGDVARMSELDQAITLQSGLSYHESGIR